MTKFLNKLFLCGILLSSVNYELAYSQTSEAAGNFNLGVDLENNIASTDNKLDTDMEIKYNKTIGAYDKDRYYIENNILYEKDRVYITIPSGDTGTVTTHTGKQYTFYKISFTGPYVVKSIPESNEYGLFLNDDNNVIMSLGSTPLASGDLVYCVNDSIMTINMNKVSDDNYKISGDKKQILYNNKCAIEKYLTKPNTNTMKWYKTDENGYVLGSYTELNKAIFTITSNEELTLSEADGNKPTLLKVTNFGQLVNNGQIIANNNTSILGPAVVLGVEENQWKNQYQTWKMLL